MAGGGDTELHGWATGEYLIWWLKGAQLPPLATSGAGNDVAPGGFGQVGTLILIGGETVNGASPYNGVQVRAGLSLDPSGLGFDVGGFILEENSTGKTITAGPPSNLIIGRPFLDTNSGRQAVNLIAFPDAIAGTVTAAQSTRLRGAEANASMDFTDSWLTKVFCGFRYLNLRDQLDVVDNTTLLAGGLGFFNGDLLTEGDIRIKRDTFLTANNFYGCQIGCVISYRNGQLEIDARPSVALGISRETLDISGLTTLFPLNGPIASAEGGLLALPSNIGRHQRDDFAVVPEANLTVGWWLTSWARMSVAYQVLYWSAVLRPGDQISLAVNQAQLPVSPNFDVNNRNGPPTTILHPTDFWAQGINLGLTLSF